MGYAILWLSYLAFCLLLIAANIAFESHSPKWIFSGKFWSILVFAGLFFINLIPVVLTLVAWRMHIRPSWLFPYTLLFLICFIAGSIFILYKGLKKSEGRVAAFLWPRAQVSVGLGIALCILIVTLHIMHLEAITDQDRLQVSTMGEAMKLLPARLPDYLDAGKEYDEAVSAFSKEKRPNWFKDCMNADFVPDSEEVKGFLKNNREVLELLRQAGNKPGFNMEADPSNLIATPIPSFENFRNLMCLLGLSAKYKAIKEGPGAGLDELETMDKLIGHLYRMPTLISQMVAVACEGSFRTPALEFILSRTPVPKKGFVAVPIKPSHSIMPFFRDSMRLEHVSMKQVFSFGFPFFYGSTKLPYLERFPYMIYRIFLFADDVDSMSEIQRQEDNAYEKPFPDGTKIVKDIQKSMETLNLGICTRQFYPVYSEYYRRANEAAAQRCLNDLALAAAAYKADKGNFPASLDVLVPDYIETLPNDPFDEKPMKLNVMEGGLDIYSIGSVREEDKAPEAIHFYLGADAYNKYRYQPALEKAKRK